MTSVQVGRPVVDVAEVSEIMPTNALLCINVGVNTVLRWYDAYLHAGRQNSSGRTRSQETYQAEAKGTKHLFRVELNELDE